MDEVTRAQPAGFVKTGCGEEHNNKTSAEYILETPRDKISERSTECIPVSTLTEQTIEKSANCTPVILRVCECDECGQQFHTALSLARHMLSHTGKQRFQCNECTKKFVHAHGLACHMKTHKRDKNCVCDVCGRKFCDKDNLVKHKLIHKKQFRFNCNVCRKGYYNKYWFTRHQLLHVRKNFECPVCRKLFVGKDSLEAHILIHDKKERKHSSSVLLLSHACPTKPSICHMQVESEWMESVTHISENEKLYPLALSSSEMSKVDCNENCSNQLYHQVSNKRSLSHHKGGAGKTFKCDNSQETLVKKNHFMRHNCMEGEMIEEFAVFEPNSELQGIPTKSPSLHKNKQNNNVVLKDVPVVSVENSLTHYVDGMSVRKECSKGGKITRGNYKRNSFHKIVSKRQSSQRSRCKFDSTTPKQVKSDFENEVELYCSDLVGQITNSQNSSHKLYSAAQEKVNSAFAREVELYCSDLIKQTSSSCTGKEVEISYWTSSKSYPGPCTLVERKLVGKCHNSCKTDKCDKARDIAPPEMDRKLEHKSRVPLKDSHTSYISNRVELKDKYAEAVKITCDCLTKQTSTYRTSYQESSEKPLCNCTSSLAEREWKDECSSALETFGNLGKQSFHQAGENLEACKNINESSPYSLLERKHGKESSETLDGDQIMPAICEMGERPWNSWWVTSKNKSRLTTRSVIQTEEKQDCLSADISTRPTSNHNRGNIKETTRKYSTSHNITTTTLRSVQTVETREFRNFTQNYKTRQTSETHKTKEMVAKCKLRIQNARKLTHQRAKTKLKADYNKKIGSLEQISSFEALSTSQKTFKCGLCFKWFTSKSNFNQHIKIHTGEKPYECLECGRRFTRNYSLKIHKELICRVGLASQTFPPAGQNGCLSNQSSHRALTKSRKLVIPGSIH